MPEPDTSCSSVYDVRHFGAIDDGVTVVTAAIQQAVDACHEAGGGTVLVPPGTYVTGTVYLKSHVTLHLANGAKLLGSSRPEDYNPDDIFPENPHFSSENVSGAHLIIAYMADHVAITGEGTIDGNSSTFFEPLPADEISLSYRSKSRNFPIKGWRPAQMVFFCRCDNVSVRDVSLNNAPYWTLFFLGCRSVQVRGVRVTNPPQTQNGDGIDIDCCREVTVSDCIIHSGDDAITLRGYSALLGEHEQPCEHVTISNCVLSSPCCGMRVGVGSGKVRHCTISNLIIKDTRTGINIISAYSAKWAGVTIENVRFSNISMDTVVPLNILLGQHARPPAAIRDLSFSHIRAVGRQGGYIGGNGGQHIRGIHLHEVDLVMTGNDVDQGFAEKTPSPTGSNGVPAALWVRHVDGLRLSGLRVEWQEAGDAWQAGVVVEHGDGVALSAVEAPPPPESVGESIRLEQVRDVRCF